MGNYLSGKRLHSCSYLTLNLPIRLTGRKFEVDFITELQDIPLGLLVPLRIWYSAFLAGKKVDMDTIIITGASGFLGRNLVRHLAAEHTTLLALGREAVRIDATTVDLRNVTSASYIYSPEGQLDVAALLQRSGHAHTASLSIVHLAGVAHNRDAVQADFNAGITDFSKSVFEGARAWATAQVPDGTPDRKVQIVNLSSIAARNPDVSARKMIAMYGRAKAKAESSLAAVCGDTISAVSLRPPAIWANDAPGAFAQLGRFIDRGIPLPFGALRTRRASVEVSTICSQIKKLLQSLEARPTQSHNVLETADGNYTLPEMIAMLAASMDCKARLFSVPPNLLRAGLHFFGKAELIDQLFTELAVSENDVQNFLNRRASALPNILMSDNVDRSEDLS